MDMRKAYDRLEWRYLEAVMFKLGFHSLWVRMVMRLVTTVSFQVLFNGGRLPQFLPTRGVRQGDPISPYLFLLAAEGLSCLLKHHSLSSELHGLMVAPSAPAVSHLLFADDGLLLFKADTETAGCLGSVKESVKTVLDVHCETLNEKYLGMPSDVGRSKMGAFKYIKDRIWSRIQGWLERLLSAGGKDVMIKSVVQAIPIFSMACFKLPKGLCQCINTMIRKFWWGCREGERKPSWVSWKDMCKPKHMGGLGFRDIRTVQSSSFGKARMAHSTKPRIVELTGTQGKGLVKRIGDGEATNPWTEQWLPRDFMLRPFGEPSNASGRAAGPEHGHLERGGTPASFSAYGCGADTTDPAEYQAS
nr:uncharacterized protein LOC127347725 [Lolium perenne]